MSKEIIIYCDESVKSDKKYSNFYGGLLVFSSHYQRIDNKLNTYLFDNNISGEVKWQKVGVSYLEKYKGLVDLVFEEISLGNIKVRIMFQKNTNLKKDLTNEQRENSYFLLYYQFLKHAFGLKYLPEEYKGTNIRLLFDKFPETMSKIETFKEHLLQLNNRLEKNNLLDKNLFTLTPNNISEIDSKNHILVQSLDLILGSMSFRLNEKHKVKSIETNKRGNKTKAKEQLYNHINRHIRNIRPKFNIGMSTGLDKKEENWEHNYRHWSFKPKD